MNEDRLNQLEQRLAKLDAQRPRDLKWALLCVDDDCLCDDDADKQTKLATAERLVDPEADFEYWRDITEWTRPRPIEDIVDEDDFENYFNEED